MQIAPLFQDILNSKKKLTPSPTYHKVAPFYNIKILRLDILSIVKMPFREIEGILAKVIKNCELLRIEIWCLDDSNDDLVERMNRRIGVKGRLTFIHSSGILASMSKSLTRADPFDCYVSEWFWIHEDGKWFTRMDM